MKYIIGLFVKKIINYVVIDNVYCNLLDMLDIFEILMFIIFLEFYFWILFIFGIDIVGG